jgi:hypothetical protein
MEIMIGAERPPVHLEGQFHMPDNAPLRRYITPDDVIEHAVKRWLPDVEQLVGVDPFGGTGTFSRVIANLGGNCHYVDNDPNHYRIAEAEVPDPHSRRVLLQEDCRLTVNR